MHLVVSINSILLFSFSHVTIKLGFLSSKISNITLFHRFLKFFLQHLNYTFFCLKFYAHQRVFRRFLILLWGIFCWVDWSTLNWRQIFITCNLNLRLWLMNPKTNTVGWTCQLLIFSRAFLRRLFKVLRHARMCTFFCCCRNKF